ncbi:protein TBATA [Talpa occidentalis]|uniref:protein TBATA n=1 Tax=Talpa occidentalis TaxID=50954 RepID=UPI0023F6F714|nr:protein TBATA [Talpa occidentalis]
MTTEMTELSQDPQISPKSLSDESKMEQETQVPDQQDPPSVPGRKVLLSVSKAHLFSSNETPFQGHKEKEIQTPSSPKAELKPVKKCEDNPRHRGNDGPQKELVIPGIMKFELTQEAPKTPKTKTPGAYRFGRLSHHSFFSRHHPHPQRVIHIKDLTGKPVCVVRDEFSLATLPRYLMGMPTIYGPIGDPQSNKEPQLSSGEAWKKELKDLASRVAIFTKENELKDKESVRTLTSQQKEEPQRKQGAKYSAETGRLIPTSTRAIGRHASRQGRRNYASGKDRGVQTILQDQELLVLELLCQILQTDSLSSIQFWLLYAPPKEKDLALGLLQTAVAQLLPEPLLSIPAEKLLDQLQEVQELQEKQLPPPSSQSLKKMKSPPVPKSEKPEYIGKAQVLQVHSSENTEEKVLMPKAEG